MPRRLGAHLALFLPFLTVLSVHAQAPRKTGPKLAPLAVNQYIVLLSDDPVSARFSGRAQLSTAGAASYRQQVEAQQRTFIRTLTSRSFQVTGSVSTVLNAVFVTAPASRV